MDWPHAPAHWLFEAGIYMVTAGTYKNAYHLNTPERRDYFQEKLFEISGEFEWELQAWAILSNHYHFIAKSPDDPRTLSRLLGKLHMVTAKEFNIQDKKTGRQVWFQYWDSKISYQKSYLARLNYVNQNPVKHGIVKEALSYPWCSATWFENSAPGSFVKTVMSFKKDRRNIKDDF